VQTPTLNSQPLAVVASTVDYIVLSPARNEGRHIQKTIDSIVAQTLRPRKWIIVNDGSTDGTRQLIEAAAKQHSWITPVNRADRGFRKPGEGVIESFNDGLRWIGDTPWEFIVKLDCDLSFAPGYFEQLIGEFRRDPRLGIASGVYFEERVPSQWLEVVMPSYHAAGACKAIRRECFEQIGGFVRDRGWDTVDEIKAMTRGWRTGHFPELKMKHWKPEGSGIGQWRTNLMLGEVYYLTGGSKLFFVLKVGWNLLQRPILLGGIAMFWGYARLLAKRQPRLVGSAEAQCYRALLRERIAARLSKLFRFGECQ
jgi:glycosyltransferase involved in cell wall biosynthesis